MKSHFGSHIRSLRKGMKMTQKDLADSIQVSGAYIHQLETGKSPPPGKERCRQLAWVLKADYDDLWLRACASRAIRSMGTEAGAAEGPRGLEIVNRGEGELLHFLRGLDARASLQLLEFMSRLAENQSDPEVHELFHSYLEAAGSV